MRLIFSILLFISFGVSAQDHTINLTLGNSGQIPTSYTGIIFNDSTYTAFPWPSVLPNGHMAVSAKKSLTHASAGAMIFGVSSDGGSTYSWNQINVSGYGLVTCSNLSQTAIQDTIFISWQTDAETSQMFFAYTVDEGSSWVYLGGITYHTPANVGAGTGYYAAQFGQIVKMPSGKKRQPYYDAPVSSGNQHSGFVDISPDCSTLSIGDTISNQTGGAYPNGTHSELWVAIIDTGATDATTSMIAIERNEQYEAYTHYKTSSGGTTGTWTRNDTYLLNVLYPAGVIDKYPVSILRGADSFYLYVGVRASADYYAAYCSITKTDLFNNTAAGYSTLHRIQDFNADTNGASIDCGYLISCFDKNGSKVTWWYDTNPTYDGAGLRQIILYQKKLD